MNGDTTANVAIKVGKNEETRPRSLAADRTGFLPVSANAAVLFEGGIGE